MMLELQKSTKKNKKIQGKEKKHLHACLPLLTKTTFEKKSMVRSACLWMTMFVVVFTT